MEFTFSEEQEALRDSARRFLADRYPIQRVAALAEGEGFPRLEWAEVAALGWTSISVPEEDGGAGLGFLEEIVLAEEMGRALFPGPFLSSVIMALPVLRAASGDGADRAGELAQAVAAGERVATLAWAGPEGRFDLEPAPPIEWVDQALSGVRLFVPDLGVSEVLVIVGGTAQGPGLWAVDRDGPGVTWRELPTVDGTRRMGEVVLEDAPALELKIEDPALLSSVRNRALAALAAEAVGVGSAALDLAVPYVRTREQFGRPIGAFQAVSHQLAQAFMELETARSLAYWAAWAVAEGTAASEGPAASVAAAMAKSRAAEAAVSTCEHAIQVHGGLGFTWEHPLQRFYKRALGTLHFMGTGPTLRAEAAAHLLD